MFPTAVGRWQKNKDLSWYAKGDESEAAQGAARARAEEIRRIKEAEQDALSAALGFPVAPRTRDVGPTGANAILQGGREMAQGEESVKKEGNSSTRAAAFTSKERGMNDRILKKEKRSRKHSSREDEEEPRHSRHDGSHHKSHRRYRSRPKDDHARRRSRSTSHERRRDAVESAPGRRSRNDRSRSRSRERRVVERRSRSRDRRRSRSRSYDRSWDDRYGYRNRQHRGISPDTYGRRNYHDERSRYR